MKKSSIFEYIGVIIVIIVSVLWFMFFFRWLSNQMDQKLYNDEQAGLYINGIKAEELIEK